MYNITIAKKANKALTSLQSRYRERIAETIQRLGYNPDDATLDIKPLTNHDTAGFRLRVVITVFCLIVMMKLSLLT